MTKRTYRVTLDGQDPFEIEGNRLEPAALGGTPAILIFRTAKDLQAIIPFQGLRSVLDVTEEQ